MRYFIEHEWTIERKGQIHTVKYAYSQICAQSNMHTVKYRTNKIFPIYICIFHITRGSPVLGELSFVLTHFSIADLQRNKHIQKNTRDCRVYQRLFSSDWFCYYKPFIGMSIGCNDRIHNQIEGDGAQEFVPNPHTLQPFESDGACSCWNYRRRHNMLTIDGWYLYW